MSFWQQRLNRLAETYYQRLSTGGLNRRLAHHICHVASELWLAQELAYLINEEGASVDLENWHASLERQRVDVTLDPPESESDSTPIYLELKAVPPDYWQNWQEVYHDLACHPIHAAKKGKPQAHFAICFLVDSISQSTVSRRPETTAKYCRYIECVPVKPGPFQPIEGFPPLYLEHTSPEFRASWPFPVPGYWPDGYEAKIRILWISNAT